MEGCIGSSGETPLGTTVGWDQALNRVRPQEIQSSSSSLKVAFETFFLIVQPRSCRILVPRPGIEPLGNEIAEP